MPDALLQLLIPELVKLLYLILVSQNEINEIQELQVVPDQQVMEYAV